MLRIRARATTGFEGCCIPPGCVARVRQPEGVGSPSRIAGRAHQRSLSCEVTLAQTLSRAPLLLLVLFLLSPVAAKDQGPSKAFAKKLQTAERKIAGRYVPIGKEAAAGRLFAIATKVMEKAVDIDSDQAEARKYLGYVKKGREWALDPERAADVRRENLVTPGVGKKGHDREAFEVFERAAALSTDCRKAWEALGYRRIDKAWEPVAPAKRETEVRSVALVRKRVEQRRLCTYGRPHFIPFGDFVGVGPYRVSAKSDGATLRLRLRHGDTAEEKLIRPGPHPGVLLEAEGGPPVYVFIDDLGRPWHLNPDVLEVELCGETLRFYDADYDGKYFEPGVDWVALASSNHAVTWVEGFILKDRRVVLVTFDDATARAEFRLEPLGPSLTHMERRVYSLMNRVRLHYGLHPVDLDDRLSGWCRSHSRYLRLNNTTGHDEDPAKPGYSIEGHKAGNASGLAFAWTGPRSFFALFDTPLHGYDLASPMFTKGAVGCIPGYLTLWQLQKEGLVWPERDDRLPAVFPPNLATGIPVDWYREKPDPRDRPAEGARWGYPIRVYLPPHGASFGPYPQAVRASLAPLKGGRPVALQVASDATNFKLFGKYVPFLVLPKKPLRPRTTYYLQISWRYRGRSHAWHSTFTTGSQWGQARDRLE